MRKLALFCVAFALAASLSTTAGAQAVSGRSGDRATVWYLRHAAWAVRLGDAVSGERPSKEHRACWC